MTAKNADLSGSNAYAGRWVAYVEGRIVAQGETADLALRAAKSQRYKERVEVRYVSVDPAAGFGPLIDRVTDIAKDEEIFLVGGAVRDALLGSSSHDFDFAVPQDAIRLARRVADALAGDFFVLDESFDAARVIVRGTDGIRDVLDFSGFRGRDLPADLAGRDFTINALAYDLRQKTIIDPLGGGDDIRSRAIRACGDTSMRDDPVRILRAVRLAAALGFKIEANTRQSMKESVGLLPRISPERQRDELLKIFGGPRPDASLRALEILGVFPYLLPELTALKARPQPAPHVYDVWEHTLAVIHHLDEILATLAGDDVPPRASGLLAGLLTGGLGRYRQQLREHFAERLNPDRSPRSLLVFAALYHDVAKPDTEAVDESGRTRFSGHDRQGAEVVAERGRALKLSNVEIARIKTIVAHHMRFPFLARRMEAQQEPPHRRAIYRFFRDTGASGVDLILLGLADLRGLYGPALMDKAWAAFVGTARILLENYWEKPEETIAPPLLISGTDLMQDRGLSQGPIIGRLLREVREAQAAGAVSTRDEALEFARRWLDTNKA